MVSRKKYLRKNYKRRSRKNQKNQKNQKKLEGRGLFSIENEKKNIIR